MKILLVDDEKPARERLKRLLAQWPEHQICAEATNGEEALLMIRQQHPDLVLLDIRMPQMDGLQVATQLLDFTPPPAIIFTTAYEEHAIEAFESQAVAYLLKPIRAERLLKALNHAQSLNRAQLNGLQSETRTTTPQPIQQRKNLQVKLGNRLELISLEDIYYFQADQKYVIVRHLNGEAIIDDSLKTLEQEFVGRFLRIHRNALIAKNKINALEKTPEGRYQVVFNGIKDHLEVSRRHLAGLRQQLQNL